MLIYALLHTVSRTGSGIYIVVKDDIEYCLSITQRIPTYFLSQVQDLDMSATYCDITSPGVRSITIILGGLLQYRGVQSTGTIRVGYPIKTGNNQYKLSLRLPLSSRILKGR
jgi:hypothetical protein